MNTSCDRRISASAMVSPGHVHGAMEESPRRACGKGERLGLGSLDNNEREKKRMQQNGGFRPGKKWPQFLAASLATMASICAGSVMGWTSQALPYLQKPTNIVEESDASNFTVIGTSSAALRNVSEVSVFLDKNGTVTEGVTPIEASWIGSLAPLGALVGALSAGHVANSIGRKKLLLLLTVPYLVGWSLIVAAGKSAPLIFTARFISGIALGTGSVIAPIYCEEIAEVRIRGALGTLFDLQVSNGILFVYIVGAYLSYLWLCITSAIIPVVFFLTFIWMPESPIYLASKGKIKEAEKSLCWLRGARYIKDYDIKPELEHIQKFVLQTAKESPSQETASKDTIIRIILILKYISKCVFTSYKSPTTKAVKIVACLMMFRQLCGINAVTFYTVDIFKGAGSTLSPSEATIIIGIAQVLATYVSPFLVERAGRRILLLFSDATMAVCHLILVVYFYLKQIDVSTKTFDWLPLLCVAMFIAAFNLGFGPLPYVMMAELVPNESKNWENGLSVSVNWILMFTVTNLFGVTLKNLGTMITFALFCGVCTVGTVVVAFIVPETKGKTREEIQLELTKR